MIISKTPLRISFVGGGSDQREYYKHGFGAVVSTTIDKYVYVSVNYRFDGLIRVAYTKSEVVDHVNKVEHDIIREAMKLTGVTSGLEISYAGDIPMGIAGTGLGTSSALAVGILNALYAYKGKKVSRETLASQACKIEIDILGRPIGKQDQYASAYGGLNRIIFYKNEKVKVEPIISYKKSTADLNKKFLLFYTNSATKSSAVLTEQRKKTKGNLHIISQMVDLTHGLKKVLLAKKHAAFGDFLHKNWLYKKQLASKISNDMIDKYYSTAIKAGARGGKILGSGGGGFLLLYCEPANQKSVRKALGELKEIPFAFESDGSKIVYKN